MSEHNHGNVAADLEGLAQRSRDIESRIAAACLRAGRARESVQLIAVSKRQPLEAIVALYQLGQRDFGENYVQELVSKAEALANLPDIRWHMLGHLQRNKVKAVLRYVSAIHSVDSIRLAETISRELEGKPQAAKSMAPALFVELNVSNQATKSGVPVEEVDGLLAQIKERKLVGPVGLMAIPAQQDHALLRRDFATLRGLAERHGLPRLSMGMSDDFEVAIEEGSTDIRVGTALFGARVP